MTKLNSEHLNGLAGGASASAKDTNRFFGDIPDRPCLEDPQTPMIPEEYQEWVAHIKETTREN